MRIIKTRFYIWILLIAIIIAMLFLYVRIPKTITERFDVKYISAERFEQFITEELKADKVERVEISRHNCNEYSIRTFSIGNVEVTDYTYANNDWGGITCNYYLFDSPIEARLYFDAQTEVFSDVLVNNEYYSDDRLGYCLINASDVLHNEYAAYYRKDNMVIYILQQNYSILPYANTGIYVTMNKICNELGVETPVGLERNSIVRDLFYNRSIDLSFV